MKNFTIENNNFLKKKKRINEDYKKKFQNLLNIWKFYK